MGEAVLIHVSELVSAMLRSTDVCARHGSGEFVVVCRVRADYTAMHFRGSSAGSSMSGSSTFFSFASARSSSWRTRSREMEK